MFSQPEFLNVIKGDIHQSRMLYNDAFGIAGRSGSIYTIGPVFRR